MKKLVLILMLALFSTSMGASSITASSNQFNSSEDCEYEYWWGFSEAFIETGSLVLAMDAGFAAQEDCEAHSGVEEFLLANPY